MTHIKICGLTRPEDIACVNRERPDYAGFIVNFPKSRRNLAPYKLEALTRLLDPGITPVGVFVDRPAGEIAALVNAGTIGIAQLHGHEDNSFIRELRRLTGAPLWQAFQVRSREDLDRALASEADLVLLDAGQGSGRVFDWRLLRGFARPFALAGGLGLHNVTPALLTGAILLDVSGGVETDGHKDPAKIHDFISKVRSFP